MQEPLLQSPANQQAHDKLRGYGYQCWLTVDAWLEIGPTDVLYAETAEDFAIFKKDEAQIGQAKDVAAPNTLRTEGVIEAINHLYAFQKQNEKIKIRYSYLTTGLITTEKGNPFGDTPGLTLWASTSVSGNLVDAERLRVFLIENIKLEADVLKYLKSLSASDFLEKILRAIVWETGHADEAGIRALVESRLAVMAERQFAASPTHARNIAAALFSHIYSVASTKEKVGLTADNLLLTIQKYLEPTLLAVLTAKRQEIFGGLFAGATDAAPNWLFTDAVPAIDPGPDFSRRTEAIAILQTTAGAATTLVIEGSSGMGKSTLAQLLSASYGGSWLHFRASEEIYRTLRGIQECIALIAQQTKPLGLLIDDLPWSRLDSGAMNLLRGLAKIAKRRGSRLIFTNQRQPTPIELGTAGLSDAVVTKAPAFTDKEIAEIAHRMGATDEQIIQKWAPLIIAQTSGHPQLVHAHLIALKAKGWPKISVEEFTAANTAVQETRDQKQLLLIDLKDNEIELLTRLSALFNPFRKDHAIAFSQKLERIAPATVIFESLNGPWIEKITSERFKLSPLLGGTLLGGLSKERVKVVNAAAVEAIVSCKPLEASDAAGALINAILGQSADHASQLMMQFMWVPKEHATALHSHLAWAPLMRTDGQEVFPGWPAVDLLFRVIQFEVAATIQPQTCLQFLEFCDQIIANTKNTETADSLRAILAFSILKVDDAPVPFQRLFWCIDVMKKVMSDAEAKGLPYVNKALPEILQAKDSAEETEALIWINIFKRAGEISGLRNLINALKQIPPSDRERYLTGLNRVRPMVLVAIDNVWVTEERKPNRSWTEIITLFNEILTTALEWKNELIAACVARGLSVIHNEYLNNPAEAEKILNKVLASDPKVAAIISEQRGKIALLAKDYATAQKHFEASVANDPWQGITLSGLVNAYQNAGTSAGHAGDWVSAASHFLLGSESAAADEDEVRAFSMLADSAYALWKHGQKQEAIFRLGLALDRAPKLPDTASSLAALKALKAVGYLVSFLAWGESGRITNTGQAAVVSGFCSHPHLDEKLRELPPPNISYFWMLYLGLEFEHIYSQPRFSEKYHELRKAPYPALQFFLLELEARRRLRNLDFNGLLLLGLETAALTAGNGALKHDHPSQLITPIDTLPNTPFDIDEPFPIPFLLASGLTFAVLNKCPLPPIFKAWRDAATGHVLEIKLVNLIDLIEKAFADSPEEVFTGAATCPNDSVRWAYVLRIIGEFPPVPTPLQVATIFCTFYRWPKTYAWFGDAIKQIDHHLSAAWLKACEQRSSFKEPTLFIPDIRELATHPDGTASHIAKIALAAMPALRVDIGQDAFKAIKHIAKS